MVLLNTQQTQAVAAYLRSLGPLSSARRDELLDHLCCTIENAMEHGKSFTTAFAECRERWNENEVKKIHSSTQNRFTMVNLIGILLLATGSLTFFSAPFSASPDGASITSVCDHDHAQANVADLLAPPSFCPLEAGFELTSGYGNRIHPFKKVKMLHRGVDWKAPLGSPVMAGGDGIVLEAGDKNQYGKCIIIVHDEIYQTLYAHLSSIDVQVGDTVTAGQRIGAVGSTGASVGSHLHYEVLKNGDPVDPLAYLP